ncbi:hypothetical protein [Leekyejoonella antrihumi]|uniref:Uncharacterized protein n=1 Tax=Leekyejoonella antrihumi TaxID=1660198 RepID=A0A563DZB4_9MICO|nr:hypothetical protein [Leekyejoonella antrihumi]TWP35600.1 hypothetical protein FGL98_13570 [Leekyejoonella antrihumi]
MTTQQPEFGSLGQRGWQAASIDGLASLTLETIPAFEIITLDGIAAFVLGGSLEQPYTIQHGSRIASMVLSAAADSTRYQPEQAPPTTPAMEEARSSIQMGARGFAARRMPGLTQLVNRIVSAAVGEMEIHKESPESQVSSLFFYAMLAVASGPGNECSELTASGVREIFHGWDALVGEGFIPPWRVVGVDDSKAAVPD